MTIEPQHTPGPWQVNGNLVSAPHYGWQGAWIAEVYHKDLYSQTDDSLKAEANTRLIAAAPDMLDALQQAVRALNTAPRFAIQETDSYRIAAKLDAVIRQATG
jgi:hypothetical protein